jgi:hypothetical protein
MPHQSQPFRGGDGLTMIGVGFPHILRISDADHEVPARTNPRIGPSMAQEPRESHLSECGLVWGAFSGYSLRTLPANPGR